MDRVRAIIMESDCIQLNDLPELAKLAGEHFRKRFREEFGDDAYIKTITILDNRVDMELSIPNEWEPMTKDILEKLREEVYQILNQGLA